MLTIKRKNITFVMLTFLGLGYFITMSNLAVGDFWKSEVALIPIQVSAIVYLTYLRWNRH
ncbi:MAG: hypothetical protein ACHBN1_36800 [Heteroscytonema crispum UTEX LB 1556]